MKISRDRITGANIKSYKERGEWAELRFMARAAEHGLHVCKPWGDSRRYDFAIEYQGKFLRVQVKSTTCRRGNSYVCTFSSRDAPRYSSEEIDFLVAYIIPKNTWFIFPVSLVLGFSRVVLSPHLNVSKYQAYEEAWHLMRGEPLLEEKEEETKPDGAESSVPVVSESGQLRAESCVTESIRHSHSVLLQEE